MRCPLISTIAITITSDYSRVQGVISFKVASMMFFFKFKTRTSQAAKIHVCLVIKDYPAVPVSLRQLLQYGVE